MSRYQILHEYDSVGADYAHNRYIERAVIPNPKSEIEQVILSDEDFHISGKKKFLWCELKDNGEVKYANEYVVNIDVGVTVRFEN